MVSGLDTLVLHLEGASFRAIPGLALQSTGTRLISHTRSCMPMGTITETELGDGCVCPSTPDAGLLELREANLKQQSRGPGPFPLLTQSPAVWLGSDWRGRLGSQCQPCTPRARTLLGSHRPLPEGAALSSPVRAMVAIRKRDRDLREALPPVTPPKNPLQDDALGGVRKVSRVMTFLPHVLLLGSLRSLASGDNLEVHRRGSELGACRDGRRGRGPCHLLGSLRLGAPPGV